MKRRKADEENWKTGSVEVWGTKGENKVESPAPMRCHDGSAHPQPWLTPSGKWPPFRVSVFAPCISTTPVDCTSPPMWAQTDRNPDAASASRPSSFLTFRASGIARASVRQSLDPLNRRQRRQQRSGLVIRHDRTNRRGPYAITRRCFRESWCFLWPMWLPRPDPGFSSFLSRYCVAPCNDGVRSGATPSATNVLGK